MGEYPEYDGMSYLTLNCTTLTDPHHDPKLRSHTGFHPRTLSDIAKQLPQPQFVPMAAELTQFLANDADDKLLVVTLCRRGRHRSVGSRWHFLTYLRQHAKTLSIKVADGPREEYVQTRLPSTRALGSRPEGELG